MKIITADGFQRSRTQGSARGLRSARSKHARLAGPIATCEREHRHLRGRTRERHGQLRRLELEGSKVPREIPAIVDQIVTYQLVDFGDRKPVRAFVCTNPNAWGYPAKDRSGRLEQFEPPDLGALLEKLTRPGKRKLLTVASPEQSAQT